MTRRLAKPQRKRSSENYSLGISRAAQSLTGSFEQQVSLHGARLALVTPNQALTYDQLNRAANRLGRAILTGSPAGDEPIALLFKHGSALITANLAVLKTGRPFVQIDDKLPQARAARLIEDAGAHAIVTDSEHYRCARELAGGDAIVVNLDTLKDDLADSNLGLAIAPSAIAYINYTSGSTGEPKGVVSDHGSELHSILVKAKALAITPSDRISLLRSHNVGATSDALLGLLNGAALCLLEITEEGLAGLADWLIGDEITVLTCVASVFRHALRNLDHNVTFPWCSLGSSRRRGAVSIRHRIVQATLHRRLPVGQPAWHQRDQDRQLFFHRQE